MQLDRGTLGKEPATTEFDKNLERSFQRLLDQLSQILNNGLLFSDNFNASIGSFMTDLTPGVESAVAHGLKRIPEGYFIISRDKAGIVYDSGTAWDSTNIYVKSNVASLAVKILIF